MTTRKKKYQLSLEDEFDFELVGIVCNHSDYRLVWGLNQQLNYRLEKCEQDFELLEKKSGIVHEHPMYRWDDEENKTSFVLLKNKVSTSTLIPEKALMDYFMFINGEVEAEQVLENLKKVDSVLGAYQFDPAEIDSCEMFDF